MWLLTTSTGKLIYLKPNTSISIGRKKGDILLPHDASISKLHASIEVKPNTEMMTDKYTSLCILKDEGSKYGTYILKDGKYEKVMTDVNLQDQDVIKIGLQREIFTVKYIPIITLISSLHDSDKNKLQEIMDLIDGIIVTNWNKFCTHLTVVKPKLTEKVVVSLAAGIPIVSIDYWDAIKFAIEKGDPFPKINNFIPNISEQYISKEIVSLSSNDKRKVLFKDLTFNFLSSKQYETYKTMVKLAGGEVALFTLKNKKDYDLEDNFIFIQYLPTDDTQDTPNNLIQEYDHICKALNARKRRVIPESEIMLAILHCSTQQYCNPKYNFGNFLKRQKKPNYSLSKTLVLDTQDVDLLVKKDLRVEQKSSHEKSKNYVEETLEIDDNISTQNRTILPDSLDDSNELTPRKECTAPRDSFIPETIDPSYDSQEADNDSLEPCTNNITNETHTSTDATCAEQHTTELSDEDDDEQIARPSMKKVCSSEVSIFIPETVDRPDSLEENDSSDVSRSKQLRKGDCNKSITKQSISEREIHQKLQSPEKPKETKGKGDWIGVNSSILDDTKQNFNASSVSIRKHPPGKTFKKAYVKIPEKRVRLSDVVDED